MPKGQTLLEVIISAAIIITGIVSLVTLIVYMQSSSRLTYQEAIALGLAQEAIEAARFIRDSNWLDREAGTGANFYDRLYSNTASDQYDYTAIYSWHPQFAQAITFDFTPDANTDSAVMVYISPTQQYSQISGTFPGGWTATPYTRYVTLYPICSDNGGVTESILTADTQICGTTGTKQIGIQVQVKVTWKNGGETLTRVLEERLYDWKYAD